MIAITSLRTVWRRLGDERGQDVIEVSGLLALVAALAALVFAIGIGPKVSHAVECAIATVFKINDAACSTSSRYVVSVTTKTIGYDGRAVIVDGGHSYTLTMTRYNDGTVTISEVDTGDLGVSARWGADAELGPLGGAGAEATVGGGGYAAGSTTWNFKNAATAERYWKQLSSGSGLGLAAHDAFSSSLIGQIPGATGLFDSLTGANGAPGAGSLPKQYETATAFGGGVQGSASAGANAYLGSFNASIGASVSAQGGLEKITSGPEKGDWEAQISANGSVDGALGDALFGPHANGTGTGDGEINVLFSSNWKPLSIQVTESHDGVYSVGNTSSQLGNLNGHGGTAPEDDEPGSGSKEGGSGEGGSGEGGSGEGSDSHEGSSEGGSGSDEGGDDDHEPLLSLEHQGGDGSGIGTLFTGTINLANYPTAAADLESALHGNPTAIVTVIEDMDEDGTETTQTYHLDRNSSTYGAEANFGGGFGGSVSTSGSTACYDPPRERIDGGPWQTVAYSGAAC